ncbi:MAG: thiamine diphosphokinase [Romboutsia sp.]|uniref:thiamine diphosphokinase n=1 Tax=Romboutsia sp. TaxID=1965302 RepID=UPI003F2A7CA8
MKVCIILNGEIKNYKSIKNIIKNNYDYIICADGGCNHAYNMEIIPDYIIGDLDSANENVIEYFKNYNVVFEEFPAKKNETDTELCIYLANKLGAINIDFIGALGGRVDHMIANICLLHGVKNMGITPRIISENEEIYIAIDEEISIDGFEGDTLSIIPVGGNANGVTLRGLEYPLKSYDMKYGLPLGISNVMLENRCYVEVISGSLLIIRNK